MQTKLTKNTVSTNSTKSFVDITASLTPTEWRRLLADLTVAARKSFTTIYRWREGKTVPEYATAEKAARVISRTFGVKATPETLFPDNRW